MKLLCPLLLLAVLFTVKNGAIPQYDGDDDYDDWNEDDWYDEDDEVEEDDESDEDDLLDRIFEGRDAKITKYPSTVLLWDEEKEGSEMCGGTIISDRWILTAAHCLPNGNTNVTPALLGSNEIFEFPYVMRVKNVILHPDYSLNTTKQLKVENDIALLELIDQIPVNNKTVKIATLPEQGEPVPVGTTVTAVGWGAVKNADHSIILQEADLNIIDNDLCKSLADKVKSGVVDDRVVCALDPRGRKRICAGDSGGPITLRSGKVVGVTSWGTTKCKVSKYPSVFTNVASYRDWIRQNSGV